MELARGFWASKTLLTAVELGVFGALATGPLSVQELRARLGVHPRSAVDFLDALVALGMLEREDGRYRNTEETGLFLDPAKPSYLGGLLEMLNARSYQFWGSLTDSPRTGDPSNEASGPDDDLFHVLSENPDQLRRFLRAMSGVTAGTAAALAERFPLGAPPGVLRPWYRSGRAAGAAGPAARSPARGWASTCRWFDRSSRSSWPATGWSPG